MQTQLTLEAYHHLPLEEGANRCVNRRRILIGIIKSKMATINLKEPIVVASFGVC